MMDQKIYFVKFFITDLIDLIQQVPCSPQPHITKKQRILKNTSYNPILLIDREIDNRRLIILRL